MGAKINRWLKAKAVVWPILAVPGVIFLFIPAIFGTLGPKPWKTVLNCSGYIALAFLVIVLALNPLVRIFRKASVLRVLNSHRRAIGVTVFLYAAIHFAAFILHSIAKKGYVAWQSFLHPVILPGFVAFLIFVPLALTSNDYSVKRLGIKRWKKIHRFVYIAEYLVCLHLILQGGTELIVAILLFSVLTLLQLIRMRRRV